MDINIIKIFFLAIIFTSCSQEIAIEPLDFLANKNLESKVLVYNSSFSPFEEKIKVVDNCIYYSRKFTKSIIFSEIKMGKTYTQKELNALDKKKEVKAFNNYKICSKKGSLFLHDGRMNIEFLSSKNNWKYDEGNGIFTACKRANTTYLFQNKELPAIKVQCNSGRYYYLLKGIGIVETGFPNSQAFKLKEIK